MTLADAITAIAEYLNIKPVDLFAAVKEDTQGGRGDGWNEQSITRDEGRILYALTRQYKPAGIIEIGTAQGCSAMHFLSAIKVNNNKGMFVSIDPDPNAGSLIPSEFLAPWTHVMGNALDWLPKFGAYGNVIIFEDSLHTYEHTRAVLDAALALKPVLLMAHDVAEYPGAAQAWQEATQGNGLTVVVDGSTAGLGIYALGLG